MRPQTYELSSSWSVRAPLESCWAFLVSPGQGWLEWWPQLRSVEVARADGLVGSRARCVWRSPLGYQLRTDLRLVEMVPHSRVRLTVGGDLHGDAEVRFRREGDGATREGDGRTAADHAGADRPTGTRIDIHWRVVTTRRWMNLAAPLLWPVYTWGHQAVMCAGERGLNRVLGASPSGG